MKYRVEENETGLTIVEYTGDNKEVVIPREINGKLVTSIGKWAFYGKDLVSVVIPDTVTKISEWAFANNELTEVNVPDSVISIGHNSFAYNELKEVNILKPSTKVNKEVYNTINTTGNISKLVITYTSLKKK